MQLPPFKGGRGVSLLILQCLIFMSACHSDNDSVAVEPEKNWEVPISFSGSEVEEDVTRAGSLLSELGVTAFKVWGFKSMSFDDKGDADPSNDEYGSKQTVFPGYVVKWQANSAATTTTNTNNWEYILLDPPDQTIKYWDWSANAYRFFAVTDVEDVTVNANAPDGPYQMTIAADARTADAMENTPFFTRLWFSTGDPVAYADKQFGRPVQLEFLKPYARVRFIFKYVYPREGIVLDNIKFQPTHDLTAATDDSVKIALKGNVTINYPLQGVDTREYYTVAVDADKSKRLAAFTEDYDPEDDSKPYPITGDGWYEVLPNLSQGSYTLTVRINKSEDSKTAVVPAQFMQWLPGYSYTYIFKVLDEGGVEIDLVESAVIDWSTVDITHTVYNW